MVGNWFDMDGEAVGTAGRDVSEQRVSLTFIGDGAFGRLFFDVIELTLPEPSAALYGTTVLSQGRHATRGVGRVVEGGALTAKVECPLSAYVTLAAGVGAQGTAEVALAGGAVRWWRVAVERVSPSPYVNGDRATGTVTLAVTNTAADGWTEQGPW